MCEYTKEVARALRELSSEEDCFDMLQVRDRVREITGPSVTVLFRPCKFQALAYFEEEGIPGFVLSTKVIELEDTKPLVDENGQFKIDEDGALESGTIKKRVFAFTALDKILGGY
jgi:hypothetical protein